MILSSKSISNESLIFTCAVFLAIAASSSVSLAASCHGGGGGQSVLVVPTSQKYQLGLSTAYTENQGRFDPYGRYRANAEGTSSSSISTTLGAAYRISDEWQVGASLPFVRNAQNLDGAARASTGPGDPVIEARYLVWEDLRFLPYRPELEVFVGVKLPVGISNYNTTESTGSDIAGDGFFVPSVGISLAKMYRPIRLGFSGTYMRPIERDIDQVRGSKADIPYRYRLGDRVELTESIGVLITNHWGATLGLKERWQFSNTKNGADEPGSAARFVSTSLSVNYALNRWLGLSGSVESSFPFYRYLANESNTQLVSLAVTYAGY